MRKVLVILVALALLMGTQIVVANAALDTSRRLFGGPSDHDVARGIFVDSNYIYIAGRTRSTGTGTWDLFLAIFNRADNSPRCIRAVDIGGVDDFGQAVVAYGGNVYVIGYTDYTVPPYSPPNILLVKFNTDCQVIAAKVYDIDFGDIPYGLTISPDGYLYIAGMSSSAAHLLKVETSNLNIVWARSVSIAGVGDSANSVTISGNKLYVTGRTSANDLFVARFDAAGNLEVYKIFRTGQFEEGRDIVVAGGKVYVAGIHQLPTGNQEFLFMRLDPNTLNQDLAKAFGTSGVEDIFSLSMVGDLAYAVGYSNYFGSQDVVLFAVNRLTGELSHAFVLGDGATDQGAYDSASTGTCLIYTGATNGWPLSYRVLDLDDVNDATISFLPPPPVSPSSSIVNPTLIPSTWTTPPFMPSIPTPIPFYDAFYSWFCPDALVVSTTTTSTVLTTSTLSTTVTSVVGTTTTVYDVRTTTITQTSITTTTSSTTTTLTQTATTTRTETTTLTQSTTYSTTTTLSTTLTYSTTTTLSTTTTSTQYFAEPVSTYVLPALLAVIAALLGASMVVGRRRRALPY
jgi:hypothetical protein